MKTFTAPTGRVGCLLSRVWTSPIPYQAFAPRSHTKLSFPKRISPPERCHWGLWHTSGGLKMFLTDWPLHLFPEVTLVTMLSFFCESIGKMHTWHFQLSWPSLALCYACISFDTAHFWAYICFFLHVIIGISFLLSLFRASYHEMCLSELPNFWRWQLSTKRMLAIPWRGTAHLLLVNVQNF